MPLETFTGTSLPPLFAEAEAVLGAEAVVLSVRRVRSTGGARYELVAADPSSAQKSRLAVAMASSPAHATTAQSAHVLVHRLQLEGRAAVVAVVGPTGSGKTTTIAKLAAHPDAFGPHTVGLVCLDTYRIGAVEQLGIFAHLSHLPMEVVYEPKDVARAMKRLRRCDVILVDTSGRGPNGRGDMEQTAEALRLLGPTEVHVVLPAGVRGDVLRRVVRNHAAFRPTHALVTKADEDPGDRTPIDVAREHLLPVRWITNGQEVPADLRTTVTASREEAAAA